MTTHPLRTLAVLLGLLACVGCASSPAPLPTVDHVDLDRFMGDWFVLGIIPNRVERGANDSIESYARRPDGKISIVNTFRKGAPDGPEKIIRMVAEVVDEDSNAEWRARPFWPISLKYLVIDLADDYRYTVVGHPSRNYVWVMARTRTLSDDDWQAILNHIEAQGFDPSRIVRVPHQAPDP